MVILIIDFFHSRFAVSIASSFHVRNAKNATTAVIKLMEAAAADTITDQNAHLADSNAATIEPAAIGSSSMFSLFYSQIKEEHYHQTKCHISRFFLLFMYFNLSNPHI